MTTDERYNGWTNYETWSVPLHIDNEQGSYNYWRERAREILTNAEPTDYSSKEEMAKIDLANALKDEITEGNPLQDASLYSQLLTGALGSVNWDEIAGHYIDDEIAEEMLDA